ncbi:MAG: undecaprenyl-diphosphatase UppP [Anaerolineaceae bacterium]|jgi:undecaprenyl-diphosphatase|nr:undecaprenyl-diphosphatase UppP [Anaerolineaceae bacterium]
MEIIQAIILGIVQGLTEYIPISSSAHLIIIPWLFNWTDPAITSLSFDVALHLGTLVAVLWFFARDWVRLIRAWFVSIKERKIAGDPDRRLAWFIVLGCIPGGIAGVLAESKIDQWFHQPNTPINKNAILVLAIIILLLAFALLIAEKSAKHTRSMEGLTFKDVVIIGLSQALAIFPGVSRSGSTITAGLALGLKREDAARFSFLLGAPIIAGAGAKSLIDLIQAGFTGNELILFPIGIVVAAITGYFCIKYLLTYLQKHSTDIFVYYRWALAGLIVLVAFLRA